MNSSEYTSIGRHQVSFQDGEKPITFNTTVYLVAFWPPRPDHHGFSIRLPGFPEEIEVIFRGSVDDLSPFYIENPEKILCDCGVQIRSLIQQFGRNWYSKHHRRCLLCQTSGALHTTKTSNRCLACENTGNIPRPSGGSTNMVDGYLLD